MPEVYPSAWDEALLPAERLLIRTIRVVASGLECGALRIWFERAAGCAGAEAYRALAAFLHQLAFHGRRRIVLSTPPDARLTQDEELLLGAFGCAQAEDYRALDQRLTELVGREAPASLGAAACIVAQAMAMGGGFLRPPEPFALAF